MPVVHCVCTHFKRGTQEVKKYLRSRIVDSEEVLNGSTNGVQSTTGQSGIVGGTGDGINAHDVLQLKTLDYR